MQSKRIFYFFTKNLTLLIELLYLKNVSYIFAKCKMLTSSVLLGIICCSTELKANFIQAFEIANRMIDNPDANPEEWEDVAQYFINGFNEMKKDMNQWWDENLPSGIQFQWKSSLISYTFTPHGYKQMDCPLVLHNWLVNTIDIYSKDAFTSYSIQTPEGIDEPTFKKRCRAFAEYIIESFGIPCLRSFAFYLNLEFCRPVAELLQFVTKDLILDLQSLTPEQICTIGVLYRCYDQIDTGIPEYAQNDYNKTMMAVNDFFVSCYKNIDVLPENTKAKLIELLTFYGKPSKENLSSFNIDLKYFLNNAILGLPIGCLRDHKDLMQALDNMIRICIQNETKLELSEKEQIFFKKSLNLKKLLQEP